MLLTSTNFKNSHQYAIYSKAVQASCFFFNIQHTQIWFHSYFPFFILSFLFFCLMLSGQQFMIHVFLFCCLSQKYKINLFLLRLFFLFFLVSSQTDWTWLFLVQHTNSASACLFYTSAKIVIQHIQWVIFASLLWSKCTDTMFLFFLMSSHPAH